MGATESNLTVTAHFIDSDWEMKTYILQTRPLYESHTSAFLFFFVPNSYRTVTSVYRYTPYAYCQKPGQTHTCHKHCCHIYWSPHTHTVRAQSQGHLTHRVYNSTGQHTPTQLPLHHYALYTIIHFTAKCISPCGQ